MDFQLFTELLLDVDDTALTLILLLCSVGAFLVRMATNNTAWALIIYPLLVLFALSTNALGQHFGWFIDLDPLQTVVMCAVTGMTVAFGLFVGAYRLTTRLLS